MKVFDNISDSTIADLKGQVKNLKDIIENLFLSKKQNNYQSKLKLKN